MLPPEPPRGDTELAGEGGGEMRLIGEAALERQFGQRHVMADKQCPRPLYPATAQELIGSLAGRQLEHP